MNSGVGGYQPTLNETPGSITVSRP
jgi:hypothetical protein